jgi:hypothetical protein
MWQIDCENFRQVGSFRLQHVGPEHMPFVEAFAAEHDLRFEVEGSTVRFSSRTAAIEKPSQQS